MDAKEKYLLFCMETYKSARGLTGKQVCDLFEKYEFDKYITDLYELLHIQGTEYLLHELDAYQATKDGQMGADKLSATE